MKSLSCLPTAAAEPVLTGFPLRLEVALESVRSVKMGAVVFMLGTVRDLEEGMPIAAIHYEAYEPMAERVIRTVVAEAERRWGVRARAVHRLGRVPAGKAAVLVAVAGVHREEAFAACRFVIDAVKERAPIWKARFEKA
jgi:molybdopterin synthase catalytic subunit